VREHVGEADRTHQLEPLRKNRATEVSLDQEDPLPRLGEGDREVGGSARLPLSGERGGDREHGDRLLDVHELEVGPKLTEGLCSGPFLAALGQQR
jgi:hypothetical protein